MKFFDFCSGIGAGHTALHNVGFECVGFSEINQKSEKTYRLLNDTNNLKNFGDLMTIDPEGLPDFDLAICGFPCQTFSIIGKRKGMADTRGKIIYGIVKILQAKSIRYCILENVKGLVHHDNGNTLKMIEGLLDEAGYSVRWKVLKSSSYGIPQIRERIYLVGARKDLSKQLSFPEENRFPLMPLSAFLADHHDRYIFDERSRGWGTFMQYLQNKYNNGRYALEDIVSKDDFTIFDTRQSDLRIYSEHCPTLRTGRHGLFYVRNRQLRRLSGMEGLLLQGFSQKQIKNITGVSDTDLLSQAGNAFTVNVIEAIARKNFK